VGNAKDIKDPIDNSQIDKSQVDKRMLSPVVAEEEQSLDLNLRPETLTILSARRSSKRTSRYSSLPQNGGKSP